MYRIRTPGYGKRDQALRWALPDRVFFACGACHVLAFAFLKRYGRRDRKALWLKPESGFSGNHIFVQTTAWVFDFHGYSRPGAFLAHAYRRGRHLWPGWDATLVELAPEALVSEPLSRAYEGLSLREPAQFLRDAMPRAEAYLARFPPPAA